MPLNTADEQLQKKIASLQELYRKNNWQMQWLYDILKEFHVWSLYSLRRTGKYQVPEKLTSWFDMIFSGRLVRIGRLIFDLQGHFGGRVKIFQSGKELTVLAESGTIFNERGYRSKEGWTSSFDDNADCWQGNLICGGLASEKCVTLEKRKWRMVLQYNDPVLGIHIPEDGSLDKKACLRSLAEAREVFGDLPNNWKGFCCQSWFLDPVFAEMLPSEANIVQFQQLGTLYPVGIESDISARIYPGKLMDMVEKRKQQGHLFMTGGMFLLKEEL